MNVIPPYGRSALIPLVTSMDDCEKEFCFTNSATYSLLHLSPQQLNDAIHLYILISQCRIHRAWLLSTCLQSTFIIGAIVRRQQELLVVHRYSALLLPVTGSESVLITSCGPYISYGVVQPFFEFLLLIVIPCNLCSPIILVILQLIVAITTPISTYYPSLQSFNLAVLLYVNFYINTVKQLIYRTKIV